mgnify:CR=1 FL=1
MPKVGRNTSLSRLARRKVIASDNLPSRGARRKNNDKDAAARNSHDAPDPTSRLVSGLDNVKTVNHKIESNNTSNAEKKRIVGTSGGDEPGIGASHQLSRGQRKRLAKREQFLKKEKMILSSLMLQKQEEQKQEEDNNGWFSSFNTST